MVLWHNWRTPTATVAVSKDAAKELLPLHFQGCLLISLVRRNATWAHFEGTPHGKWTHLEKANSGLPPCHGASCTGADPSILQFRESPHVPFIGVQINGFLPSKLQSH